MLLYLHAHPQLHLPCSGLICVDAADKDWAVSPCVTFACRCKRCWRSSRSSMRATGRLAVPRRSITRLRHRCASQSSMNLMERKPASIYA